MTIIGHTLVWHSQVPNWLFADKGGNDVSREVLIERMKNHIYTLVGRYKGRVYGWDVVNEAVTGSGALRKTKWLELIGDDYIELAFKFAHEADPDAELYYNDFGMDNPGKRSGVVNLVRKLQHKGIAIHGIGMQGHYSLGVSLDEVEKSISAFSGLDVNVMMTELDITVLPFPSKKLTADVNKKHMYMKSLNPYPDGLPDSVQQKLTDTYAGLFSIFLNHEGAITRVTFWGLNDGWLTQKHQTRLAVGLTPV
jgi:endo-1,4-beta-xylanase